MTTTNKIATLYFKCETEGPYNSFGTITLVAKYAVPSGAKIKAIDYGDIERSLTNAVRDALVLAEDQKGGAE